MYYKEHLELETGIFLRLYIRYNHIQLYLTIFLQIGYSKLRKS
jgi:hypothetical protein